MSEILPFRSSGAARRRDYVGQAAEIVIFPGIRIEYHDRQSRPERRPRPGRSAAPRADTELSS
jgi:hypothetical protein